MGTGLCRQGGVYTMQGVSPTRFVYSFKNREGAYRFP